MAKHRTKFIEACSDKFMHNSVRSHHNISIELRSGLCIVLTCFCVCVCVCVFVCAFWCAWKKFPVAWPNFVQVWAVRHIASHFTLQTLSCRGVCGRSSLQNCLMVLTHCVSTSLNIVLCIMPNISALEIKRICPKMFFQTSCDCSGHTLQTLLPWHF